MNASTEWERSQLPSIPLTPEVADLLARIDRIDPGRRAAYHTAFDAWVSDQRAHATETRVA